MSHRLVKPGSRITRVYYAVPSAYTIGDKFDTWDDAVRHAQQRRADLVASLTETLGGWSTPKQIEDAADAQVRVDLRWMIEDPDGGGIDTVIESYANVAALCRWPAEDVS